MNKLLLFGTIIFISGCCSLTSTNKKCECKKVYLDANEYITQFVDTTTNISPRYILNVNNKPVYNIYRSITGFIKKNEACWIGQKKSKIIELLGKPDSDFYANHLGKRNFTYTITVQHQGITPKNVFTITVIYENSYDEKISKVIAGGAPFIITVK